MNTNTLRHELIKDPASIGYGILSDAVAAAAINSTTNGRTRLEAISSSELLAWAAAEGRLDRISDAAANHSMAAIRSVAKAAELLIARDGTTLDLSLKTREAMVDALVDAGVLTSDEKKSLVAHATKPISRAEELGLGYVAARHVTRARKS